MKNKVPRLTFKNLDDILIYLKYSTHNHAIRIRDEDLLKICPNVHKDDAYSILYKLCKSGLIEYVLEVENNKKVREYYISLKGIIFIENGGFVGKKKKSSSLYLFSRLSMLFIVITALISSCNLSLGLYNCFYNKKKDYDVYYRAKNSYQQQEKIKPRINKQ